MSTALLFSNYARGIFVVDIPRSLELGNGGGRIYATKAPNEPYETPEPKGDKRKALISTFPAEHIEYHKLLGNEIRCAAQGLRSFHDCREWYLPRQESHEAGEELQLYDAAHVDADLRESLPIILSSLLNEFPSEESICHTVVLNPNRCPTFIRLHSETHIFVPAKSAFLWTDVARGLKLFQEYTIGSDLQFDMILMDPPWSNRSVRNGSRYSTMEKQVSDPFECALTIVEKHGRPNGHVAVWITNKAAVQRRVMTLLGHLNFILIEEWIWVKVTTEGEPVTPLDGIWRKPYETLLLFRRNLQPCAPLRRYIFAVPDVHSRKPNLKELFSEIIRPSSVLEIFARNLTSGWWCIGNEVLKFQQQSAWHYWPQSVGIHSPSTECLAQCP